MRREKAELEKQEWKTNNERSIRIDISAAVLVKSVICFLFRPEKGGIVDE